MIVCNGIVGLCMLIGGMRYREQDFQGTGANAYLSVLFMFATITLIMPNYTLTAPGPVYSTTQLAFVSVVTLLLYAVFLYTQTIRHRDYFVGCAGEPAAHGEPLSDRMLGISIALLLLALVAVVLLAKKFSAGGRRRHRKDRRAAGLCRRAGRGADPAAGRLAAVAAARKNDLQKSINLALGSSLATIGLTIPAVAVAAYALDKQLVLGLATRTW